MSVYSLTCVEAFFNFPLSINSVLFQHEGMEKTRNWRLSSPFTIICRFIVFQAISPKAHTKALQSECHTISEGSAQIRCHESHS